jgi:4a-hydroxytetrahydrobiopterin dehydratase
VLSFTFFDQLYRNKVFGRVGINSTVVLEGAMSELAQGKCVPCRGGVPPLTGEERSSLLTKLGGDWVVVDGHHLEMVYRLDDFRQALDFTVRVGEMAEEQDHHPDIYLTWGQVKVTIWTHKIDGLTESDFVFAAKCDTLR